MMGETVELEAAAEARPLVAGKKRISSELDFEAKTSCDFVYSSYVTEGLIIRVYVPKSMFAAQPKSVRATVTVRVDGRGGV